MKCAMIATWLIASAVLLLPGAVRADTSQTGLEPVGSAPSAISRYGMVCIKNTTGRPINYSIKWGNGGWENYSVTEEPSSWRSHSWRYDAPGRALSPTLTIRFDSDMTDAESWVEYTLPRYQAADDRCELGKGYQFEWEPGSTRFIDLKSTN